MHSASFSVFHKRSELPSGSVLLFDDLVVREFAVTLLADRKEV
jgi:hypothetical protein